MAYLVKYHTEGIKAVKFGHNAPYSDLEESPLITGQFPVFVFVRLSYASISTCPYCDMKVQNSPSFLSTSKEIKLNM